MSTYWLTNVRLEKGFRYDHGGIAGTETEIRHLLIRDGVIAEIRSDLPVAAVPHKDAGQLLALPGFADMHVHIDKTYYGGPWKAVMPAAKGIFTRLGEEKQILPAQLPVAKDRAEKLLDLLIRHGATHVRTHCNIDPIIGLKNLEATTQALRGYDEKLSYEIVAFPQHGLLRSNSVQLVREALRSGATHVGGVDPASLDQDIEASLQTVMELAVEANADIDIHLHDPDHLGAFTIKRLAALTAEAGWQGRVTISHALALGGISLREAADMAEMLAALRIGITSSVPIPATIPIPLLHEKGVSVNLGQDSITDHWSPFGTGDNLEKARRLAERFRWSDERALGQALRFITRGKTPLDRQGNRVWPVVGDEASLVLMEAVCSAEAVARRARRVAVIYKGNLSAGGLPA